MTRLRSLLCAGSLPFAAVGACLAQITPASFEVRTIDSSPDVVGTYTSIAIDPDDFPHVTYYDETAQTLRHTWETTGGWVTEVVDPAPLVLGTHSSLAIRPSGELHVSYYSSGLPGLRYAHRTGSIGAAPWVIETVETNSDRPGAWSSLELDAAGVPNIAYQEVLSMDLKYAWKPGGQWLTEIADSAGSRGFFATLALDPAGNAHVVHAETPWTLRYAVRSGGSWSSSEIDSVGILNCDFELDPAGNPHLVFYDAKKKTLVYGTAAGGSWTFQPIESGFFVISYMALEIDSSGRPHVAYYYDQTQDLKYAVLEATGWTTTTVDATGRVGTWVDLALDSNDVPHISYYDLDHGDLKYATGRALAIGDVDFNQAAQPETRRLPLVAGKPTLARVFLDPAQFNGASPALEGVLDLYWPGGGATYPDINSTTFVPGTNEADLDQSLNFLLTFPDPATSPLDSITITVREIGQTGGFPLRPVRWGPGSQGYGIPVIENRRAPRILHVRSETLNCFGAVVDSVNASMIRAELPLAEAIFPTPGMSHAVHPIPYRHKDPTGFPGCRSDYGDMVRVLKEYMAGAAPLGVDAVCLWMARADNSWPYGQHDSRWDVPRPATVSDWTRGLWVEHRPGRSASVFAHELGHALGQLGPGPFPMPRPDGHNPYAKKIDDYEPLLWGIGVDPADRAGYGVARAGTTSDLMNQSKVDPSRTNANTWVSVQTYEGLLASSALAPARLPRTVVPAIEVSGETAWDTSLRLFPSRSLQAEPGPFSVDSPVRVRAFGSVGGVPLFEHGVELGGDTYADASGPGDPESRPIDEPSFFRFCIPAQDSVGTPVEAFELVRVAADSSVRVLARVDRSANAPAIPSVSVAPGAMLSGPVNLTWTGSDADGDSLEYCVSYSPDGGTTRWPLSLFTGEPSAAFDADVLPGSLPGAGLIEISVTDGFNTTSTTVDGLTVGTRTPPTVTIVSPQPGSAAGVLVLSGIAWDRDDTFVDGPSLEWFSSIDGALGTGPTTVAVLSEGAHVITLVATDSDGQTGADSVAVTVQSRRPSAAGNLAADSRGGATIAGRGVPRQSPGGETERGSLHLSARPNPSSGRIVLSVEGSRGPATLRIYDVSGRRVRTLSDGSERPGEWTAVWDGRGDDGAPTAPGIYFARLSGGRTTRAIKVVRLR